MGYSFALNYLLYLDLLSLRFPGRVLGDPASAALGEGCFFDTNYHLNMPGTSRRTEYLVGLLQSWKE